MPVLGVLLPLLALGRLDFLRGSEPKKGGPKKVVVCGVTTTIFEPTPSVRTFVKHMPHSHLVVVGDLKTPNASWREYEGTSSGSVTYLSPVDQLSMPFRSVRLLPWNHFGRKNIGFLYAIKQQAEWIFDFDDDNELRLGTWHRGGLLNTLLDPALTTTHRLLTPSTHLYNPYPDFKPVSGKGSGATFLWPRGFPLDYIHDQRTYDQPATTVVNASAVHIYQSLANHNPDVDAIYRMTRELPVTFSAESEVLALSSGTYAPMNAQATLFRSSAAWGMILPITVRPRVTDIWRSYITQRLLWEVGGLAAFTSAIVTQFRNPHSYQKDFDDEVDVYMKVTKLLATLAKWTSTPNEPLKHAYINIVENLVATKILQPCDLELARLWVHDLDVMGYAWPTIGNPQPVRVHEVAPMFDERSNAPPSHNPPPPSPQAVASHTRPPAWSDPHVGCITNWQGRGDGFGAQYIEAISTMRMARHWRKPYCHQELRHVTELAKQTKANTIIRGVNQAPFNDVINLRSDVPGMNCSRCRDISHGVVYPAKPATRIKEVFSTFGKPNGYAKTDIRHNIATPATNAWPDEFRAELRERFDEGKPGKSRCPWYPSNRVNVAVHVRRGFDANSTTGTPGSGYGKARPNPRYMNLEIVEKVMMEIRRKHKNHSRRYGGKALLFHVYSIGDPREFDGMVAHGDVLLQFDRQTVETWHAMVTADILVTSTSTLSFTAALVNTKAEIYYAMTIYQNLIPGFIPFDANSILPPLQPECKAPSTASG